MPKGKFPRTAEYRRKISEAHKGKKHTDEHKRKISESVKKQHAEGRGNYAGFHSRTAREKTRLKLLGHKNTPEGRKHWFWKGNKVGKGSLHAWIARHKKKTGKCELCGSERGLNKKGQINTDWANISGKYKRRLDDFQELCRSCHRHTDPLKGKIKQPT